MTPSVNTKKEINDVLEGLIADLRARSGGMSVITPLPSSRITDLIDECVDAQVKLLDLVDESKEILAFKKEVLALEARINRRRIILVTMPAILVLYLGIWGMFAVISLVDVPKFIKDTLGVEAPTKLITLGIAGALVYLSTSLMSYFSDGSDSIRQFAAVAKFTIQLFLAVIVPVILVALFFTQTGEIAELKVSPELISFACGYSAKLVIDIFNKFVEKVSKMIEAI